MIPTGALFQKSLSSAMFMLDGCHFPNMAIQLFVSQSLRDGRFAKNLILDKGVEPCFGNATGIPFVNRPVRNGSAPWLHAYIYVRW